MGFHLLNPNENWETKIFHGIGDPNAYSYRNLYHLRYSRGGGVTEPYVLHVEPQMSSLFRIEFILDVKIDELKMKTKSE